MNCSEAIRETFVDWPVDVLEQWLLPNCERQGFAWPPTEPFSQSVWNRVLLGRPVDWLLKLNWKLKSAPLDMDCFSRVDQFLIGKSADAQSGRQDFDGFRVKNTADRLENIKRYISEHGELPRAPVFIKQHDGFRIADGFHRVAILLTLPQNKEIESAILSGSQRKCSHFFWVGVHHGR